MGTKIMFLSTCFIRENPVTKENELQSFEEMFKASLKKSENFITCGKYLH